MHAILDPARFAAAWASIANCPPTIPHRTDAIARLQSEMTQGGRRVTWQEAEAEYGRRYATDAAMSALDEGYEQDLKDGFDLKYGK